MSVGVANPFHPHPYLPSSLQLTGWQPLVMPFTEILLIFFGGAGLVALFSYTLSGEKRELLTTGPGKYANASTSFTSI